MNLKQRIFQGLAGNFEGLSNGFNRLNNYIFGVQRKCYTLIGGMSGAFKTTLVDYIVTNAILDAEAKKVPLNLFYYSYEIDELTKKCNWLSRIIYQKHDMIIPPERIKGLGSNRLTKEEQYIVDSEIEYVDILFSKINFRYISSNPTGIYNELWKFAETNGVLQYEEYIDEHENSKKRIKSYESNNSNGYNVVVLDHLYHLRKERGFETKEVIDKYSEYCVNLRNMFGYSFFNVQMFNDGLTNKKIAPLLSN